MLKAFILASFVAIATAVPLVAEQSEFDSYIAKFGFSWEKGTTEYNLKKEVFTNNLNKITAHNARNTSYTMGINKFTALNHAEMSAFFGTTFVPRSSSSLYSSHPVGDLPASVDWSAVGATTPVKNQASCGSCWAFAGIQAIESALFINTGKLISLSPQEFVSCMPNPRECGGTGGCAGATDELLYEYAMANNVTTEAAYPYTSGGGGVAKCALAAKAKAASVAGYKQVPHNSLAGVMAALAVQPLAISVDATNFGTYGGGIFENCGVALNHGVLLVGYGEDNGELYWKVKNSWGPEWGEKGYIRLKRTASGTAPPCATNHDVGGEGLNCKGDAPDYTVCGTCGLLYDAVYPTGVAML